MSLINDALKKAMHARPKGHAPAAGLPTPPATNPAPGPGISRILLPVCLVVVLGVAGFFLWQCYSSYTRDLKVRANATATAAPVVTNPPAAVVAPVPAVEPATNQPAVVETPKPDPITYRLQSIFYRPNNPTAVINGKMVYVGDRVGNVRVLTIEKDSVTILTSTGQTNILDL